ncbi:unnamed protein product [Arctogadus glacialis]
MCCGTTARGLCLWTGPRHGGDLRYITLPHLSLLNGLFDQFSLFWSQGYICSRLWSDGRLQPFAPRVKGYWFLVPLFAPFLGVVGYQLMVGYNVEGEARIQRRREKEESLKCTTITTINEEAEEAFVSCVVTI